MKNRLASLSFYLVLTSVPWALTVPNSAFAQNPIQNTANPANQPDSGDQPPATSRANNLPRRLANAHSHNDYYQPRPLFDAWELGFGSIEADVVLVKGKLLVGHSLLETISDRDLRRTYLQPLMERFQSDGRIYAEPSTLILLIDFKSDAEESYAALKSVLADFKPMLARVEQGRLIEGAVQVIISGNRPIHTMRGETDRLAFLDGRLDDLQDNPPTHLIPLISDNWSSHFKWKGRGQVSEDDLAKLRSIVERVHQQQRILRFWATPDHAAAWRLLRDNQVDLINTDKIQQFADFLR
jgi:hypothetical protein